MATVDDLLKDLKKKTMASFLQGTSFTPTVPKASVSSSAQQTLMNSKNILNAGNNAIGNKTTNVTPTINALDEDALRVNMAKNRTEPTAAMKAASFVGRNLYNGTIKPLGQAIDKQYEKLDDYDFGKNALNNAYTTSASQSQNVWDEDLLRTQRLINNRNELLSYMTPVQKLQYNSLPDNRRKDYFDTIMQQLQIKKGTQRAEEIRNIDDTTTQNLQKLMLSFEGGGNSAKSGLKGAYNLLRGADETVAKDASEYAFEKLRPETTGAMGVVMDLANTTGRMAPSMLAGMAGAPLGVGAIGTVGMGVSSAGSGYDTAISQGYTPEQAAAYGIASGIKEAALQRIVGALPGVSGAEGAITKALGKYSDDVLSKIINNPAIASAVTRVVGNALSEGTEEAMQEVLDVGLRNVLLGENNEVDWGNVAYSGVLGGITGGAFAAPSGVSAYRDTQNRVEIGNELKGDLERVIQDMEADERAAAYNEWINTPKLTGPTNTFYGTSDGKVVGGKPYTVEDVEGVLAQYEEMKKANKQLADAWLEGELQKFAPTTPLLKRATDFYAGAKGVGTEYPMKKPSEYAVNTRNLYLGRSNVDAIKKAFYSPVTSKQLMVKDVPSDVQALLMGTAGQGDVKQASPTIPAQEVLLNQKAKNPKRKKKPTADTENLIITEEDEIAFKQTDTYKEWLNRFNKEVINGRPIKGLYNEYGKLFEDFVRKQRASTSVQDVLTEQKQNKSKPKGKKKAEEEDTLRVSEADEIAFKQTNVYREWLSRFQAEMSKAKPSPVKIKGLFGEYGKLFEGFVREQRAGASVQETLLNQKAEVPSKKSENTTSTNFSQNTVGSAEYDPEGLQAKVDEFGAIEEGEGPKARVAQIPKRIDDSGLNTSRFARTAVEAEATTDEMASEIEQGVNKGDFRYIPTTNKELVDKATKRIETMGFDSAIKNWNDRVENDKLLTAEDITMAEQLYNAAVNAGDTKTAYKILGDLSAYGSMYGQAIEALRILKTLGPDAKLYHVEGVKNLLNKEIGLGNLKAVNKDLGVTINEELVDKMMKAETQEEADAYMEEIKQDMANQVEVSFYEALQEFRYLMMLANPTTHIRNIAGNAIMQPAVRVKDAIGAGLEAVAKTNKTKSVIKNKDAKEFAKADYEAIKNNFKNDNKYSMYSDILRKRTVFKGVLTPLEKARVLNSNALSGEDNFFKGITYRNALAGYMTANNHTADYYNSPEGANDLAKAREYAMNEALKATYQDASKLANALNKFEKDSIAGKVFIGGLLPFKKTPVNILKRGVEYSPAGLLKLANDINSAKKNGNPMTPEQIVDSVSASLTGTGIMALGMFLKSIGALSGAYDEDEEIARLQKAQGKQEYALNIGDKSFDLSQFSPIAMPLLVGAQLQDLIEGEGWDFAETLDVLMRVADPIVETSMLSGLADAINTYNFGASNTSAVSSIIGSSIKNYATSFLPTVGGKVAKTIDPVLRSTYVDKNSSLPKSAQEMLMSMQYKTPGAYSKLEPSLDIWGRETRNDNFVSRVFNNFVNPSTTKKVNETEVDQEVQRVYEQTGTTGIIPKKPDKYVNYKGERKDYTAEEYTQLVKGRNGQSFTDLEEMFENPLYSNLSDADKAEVIKDVYNYNGIKAKESIGGYSSDDDDKIDELKNYGMSTAQAILLQQSLSSIGNNNDLEASEKRAEKIDAIKASDVPKNKQGQLILAQGTETCRETYAYVKSTFTEEQWVRIYDAVSSGNESVKIGNLQMLGYSYAQAKQILLIYKAAKKKRDNTKK